MWMGIRPLQRSSENLSAPENSDDAAGAVLSATSTNIVEQDHRAIKRRVRASQGFRSFDSAMQTIQGIETVNMIRKGQVRWLEKGNLLGQIAFMAGLFGLPAVV